jgi:hypothetical protein
MIAFTLLALLLRLLGTLGGASGRPRARGSTPAPPRAEPARCAEPARAARPDGDPDTPRSASDDGPAEHPESLTAVLDPGAEEYLAWLADHHWPFDEYLELERGWLPDSDRQVDLDWQTGLETYEPAPVRSTCPRCLRHSDDVWPCWTCGRLLHSACGHGLRRRSVRRPYRTRDMNAEAVTAEWICTDCSCVVGLDVERGDDRPGTGGTG